MSVPIHTHSMQYSCGSTTPTICLLPTGKNKAFRIRLHVYSFCLIKQNTWTKMMNNKQCDCRTDENDGAKTSKTKIPHSVHMFPDQSTSHCGRLSPNIDSSSFRISCTSAVVKTSHWKPLHPCLTQIIPMICLSLRNECMKFFIYIAHKNFTIRGNVHSAPHRQTDTKNR